jgi:hypothetical protein
VRAARGSTPAVASTEVAFAGGVGVSGQFSARPCYHQLLQLSTGAPVTLWPIR